MMKRPLLWFAISWIVGSILSFQWPIIAMPIWLTVALSIAAVYFLLSKPAYRPNLTVIVVLLFVSYGYSEWRDGRNVTSVLAVNGNLDQLSGSNVEVEGSIASDVDVDGDRAVFVLSVSALRFHDAASYPMHERMRVSVRLAQKQEQDDAARLERTQVVRLSGVIIRPEPSRNFGGFDYRRYLRHQHIHWLLSVKGIDSISLLNTEANRFDPRQVLFWNDKLRSALAHRMESIFPSDQAGLMKSMLIGWQTDMDTEQYNQFSKLGLTHILAISGMNVAVFLGLLFLLLKRLKVTRETSLWIGIALMPGYVLMTGASASIVRAGLVAMLALYAARRGWLKDGLHLTAVAAVAMLIWEPYYLFDVGFQLSFLITVSLLVGVPRVAALLPLRHNGVKQAAAITIVSQLVSFPVTVTYFNGFSLLSWLANSLFVPVFGAVLFPSALISLFVGVIWLPLGKLAGEASGLLSRLTVACIDRLARIDGFQLIWPTPSPVWTGLYFAFLVLLYGFVAKRRLSKDRRGSLWPVAALGIAMALLLLYGYTPDRFSRKGWVEFIDVGQGDAALIRTPAGQYILVDGGGTLTFRKPGEDWKERRKPFEVGRSVVVPLLKQHGVHQLDYVIATHEDQDHIGGLQAVAEQIPIRHFIFNGTLKPGPTVDRLFRTLLDKHVPLLAAPSKPIIQLDNQTELRILPIRPTNSAASKLRVASKQNNESIVFVLTMQGYRWLFTGDMEKSEEEAMLAAMESNSEFKRQQSLPPVDVIKVAHHGSKTSSSEPWLGRWHPKLAVISVGARNTYGHPSPQVLDRLNGLGIPVWRTDMNGALRMTIRPSELQLEAKLSTETAD